MTKVNDYETIEMTADTVVERELVNESDRVYAIINILNAGESDILINTTGDFTGGKYITLPPNTAYNGKKLRGSMNMYFKASGADGKIVIALQ